MPKPLESTFELDVPVPTRDDFVKIIGDCDFDYFTSHFQQIVDKSRQLVPMKLNRFQREVFKKLLPLVDPKTRIDHSRTAIFVKSRRVGASTGMIAFVNFLLSYVEGISNLNVLHLFQDAGAASKLFNTKVKDIVTGVHPDLMSTIYKESANSSIVLNYDNLLGVRRHNSYELASANTSSLRGSDFHVAILDEAASYRHPEDVEAAVAPMMPPHGFSLTVFASTFDDKMGPWYKEKIVAAMEHPEEYELIFVPWFASYPEILTGYPLEAIELTEYDQKVIMPAMAEYGIPKENWGDCLLWRHRMEATMSESNMRKEFPTTLEEVLAIGESEAVFASDSIERQKPNVLPDRTYRLVVDTLTQRPELQADEDGDVVVYCPPRAGHQYFLACDPVNSISDDSDFFAASVFDVKNNEQVAMLNIRGVVIEDLADLTEGLSKVYNRALICPESNLSQALVACLRAKGCYSFYYPNKQARAKKEPGFRTTVATKPMMIDKLKLMLERGTIIIHSAETLRQLSKYEKQKSKSGRVVMSAPKGDHDDQVIPLALYALSKTDSELMGKTGQGFTIL